MISAFLASDAAGFVIGSVFAMVFSWDRNRSIPWAILAATLSWIYVIYWAVTRLRDVRC